MGRSLNGLFLNFQKMAGLGVVGDLGVGGLINIQTSRLLGQEKHAQLRSFLAVTRTVYLVMAVVMGAIFFLISPHLFRSLRFAGEPGVGSLLLLSAVGAGAIIMVALNSYINNLNYGSGNIVWPIIPTFVITQCAVLVHWLLARQGAPLWAQYLPYVAAAVLVHALGWVFVRLSYPDLGTFLPLHFNRSELVELGVKSFWVYLYSVGAGIYMATDTFLISAGFGPEWVPLYQYNYKLTELAFFVVASASLASLPKLTQWIASSDGPTRERGIQEALRLNKFQTFLGCCAAFVYLNVNDWFVSKWLGKDFHAPVAWQIAFATTLAVNSAGLMGSDLIARCCERGIRVGGMAGLAASLFNFALAFAAMKQRSIAGVAFALAATAAVQGLSFGWYSCRQLRISWWRLSLKNWLLALTFVGLGWVARASIPKAGNWVLAVLLIVSPLAFLLAARLVGISLDDLQHEKRVFQGIFTRMR